jgi:hypothetical protein
VCKRTLLFPVFKRPFVVIPHTRKTAAFAAATFYRRLGLGRMRGIVGGVSFHGLESKHSQRPGQGQWLGWKSPGGGGRFSHCRSGTRPLLSLITHLHEPAKGRSTLHAQFFNFALRALRSAGCFTFNFQSSIFNLKFPLFYLWTTFPLFPVEFPCRTRS